MRLRVSLPAFPSDFSIRHRFPKGTDGFVLGKSPGETRDKQAREGEQIKIIDNNRKKHLDFPFQNEYY